MRPPEDRQANPDQIMILDARPELDVIRGALEDRRFMGRLTMHDTADDLSRRFRQETMHRPPDAHSADGTMVWNEGAEFMVSADDAPVVYAAALRIISQRGPLNRLANSRSRRKEAAIHIVEVLTFLLSEPG